MRLRRHFPLLSLLIALFVCGLIFAGSALAGEDTKKQKKKDAIRIAVTFDELPAAQSFEQADRDALSYLVLDALKRHKVKAAGFVVGGTVGNSFDLLGQWLNEGHVLGNMTYSNQSVDEIGIEKFISDIKLGEQTIEEMLSGFGQKKRYFRFPYLHYGNSTTAKRQLTLFLESKDYVIGHATVVPEDYLYNLTLEKLGKYPDSAEYDALLNEYVNHVLDELIRVDKLATQLGSKKTRHILLLRLNRLNAVFLDEMLTALENEGCKFITLDNALEDRVYERPEGYFGGRGIGFIDMLDQSNPDMVPAEE